MEEAIINDESILLIDSHHGIYIPHLFWTHHRNELNGFSHEEMAMFNEDLKSPDEENYWDSWEDILNRGEIERDKKKYILHHEEDLWLILKDSTQENS